MSRLEDTANNYALRVTDQATVYTTGAGDATHGNYQSVLGVPTFYTPAGVAESLASTALATFKDTIFKITDDADITKAFQFQASGITAGNTRVYTVPDYNGTLATLAGAEILTNKTLTTPTIADFTNATHNHTNAAGGGQLTDAALSAAVTVPKGGTGLATLTAHAALIANGTGNVLFLTPGTARNAMISDGTDWTSRALVDADIPDALTISGGTVNNSIIGGSTPASITGTTITANTRFVGPIIAPSADSTTALVFTKTDGSTGIGAWDSTNKRLRVGDGSAPATTLDILTSDAATTTVTNVVTIGHDSSGTPAANYGTGITIQGKSSTTVGQSMGDLQWIWTTATHASRKARGILTAYDTASRTCIQWEASGTVAMIGFFSTSPVAQNANTIAIDTGMDNYGLFASGRSTAKFDNPLNLVGKITTYNNVATQGYGVPSIVNVVSSLAQTADVTTVNVTNAGTAGLYRVCVYLICTTADAAAGGVTITFTWTDNVGSTTSAITQVLTATGRQTSIFFVRLNSGNLSYATSHTGSYGTAQYGYYYEVERLL